MNRIQCPPWQLTIAYSCDNKVTLDYALPLPPDNVKQETVSVLDIVSPAPLEGIRTTRAQQVDG